MQVCSGKIYSAEEIREGEEMMIVIEVSKATLTMMSPESPTIPIEQRQIQKYIWSPDQFPPLLQICLLSLCVIQLSGHREVLTFTSILWTLITHFSRSTEKHKYIHLTHTRARTHTHVSTIANEQQL